MFKLGGGGGGEAFIQGALIFGMMVLLLMPTMISIFMPVATDTGLETYTSEETLNDVLSAYNNFTNNSTAKEQPWALTGIYTPYLGGTYHYTSDGWLYGTRITNYSPSQYLQRDGAYTVVQGMDGKENYAQRDPNDSQAGNYDYTGVLYTYRVPEGDVLLNGHKNGDVYTYVTMDVNQKSDIFFTDQTKKTQGNAFYYEYSGYRYCWQPLQDGYTQYTGDDNETHVTKINATSSSLSLIWYSFVGQSGISGQLILSGSDRGVAYLTAQDIIKAFNPTINTARFEMQFNGIPMIIYIRIDPSETIKGTSIEDCYNMGYWSIMVASLSTNPEDYYSASYSLSPDKIWDTAISLLSFDLDEYDMSPTMKSLASIVFCGILLTMLLSIALTHPEVLLIAAVAGLIAVITNVISGGIDIDLGDIFPFVDMLEGGR